MTTFLILVGEAKCGTSTMHKYLMKHPNIAKSRKEGNYIAITPTPTLRGYLQALRGNNISKVVCDVSPKYFRTTGIEKKLHNIIPNAKIVLMLRNPVDRLYSNYYMNLKQDFRGSFNQYIDSSLHKNAKNPNINQYSKNLQRWYKYFDKDQILIIKSEDFFKNETTIVNIIFTFAGLPKISLTRINPIIPFEKPNSKPMTHYPPLNLDTRKKLEQEFNTEVQSFKALTGIDFWNSS